MFLHENISDPEVVALAECSWIQRRM